MTRRNLAHVLIDPGAGSLLGVVGITEAAMRFHHMFIGGFVWRRKGSVVLVLPLVVIFVGLAVLVRDKAQPKSR